MTFDELAAYEMEEQQFPKVHFNADERMLDEMTDRGYCSFASVELEDGSLHRIVCWGPVRIGQDIQSEFESGAFYFAERRMIVLKEVTRENIESAVRALVKEGFFTSTG